MKNYYRIMLGRKSVYTTECISGGFVGVDFDFHQDLTGKLPETWREFNKQFIPIYLSTHPDKSRIGAGLACGATWTVCKGIKIGDIVLCPDGNGLYRLGEVTGDYYYTEGAILQHRRKVRWLDKTIAREDMSDGLRRSTGALGTVSNVSVHDDEIKRFLDDETNVEPCEEITDPIAFAMEKHLEDFLVSNWSQTELGKEFDIYTSDDEEEVGQQYPTDAGLIDILAISKDKKRLLVVELKRGHTSDAVVGQVLRYMGCLKEQAEAGQSVEGAIIAFEDDQKLRWALSNVPTVSFYRYEVSFKLNKS